MVLANITAYDTYTKSSDDMVYYYQVVHQLLFKIECVYYLLVFTAELHISHRGHHFPQSTKLKIHVSNI